MSTRCKFEMNVVLEDGDTGATLWKYHHSNCPPAGGLYERFLENREKQPATSYPRTETYAMLLAGLGLLGFIARRHKTA